MATVKKGLANKWLVLALLLAALGAVLTVTLLPARGAGCYHQVRWPHGEDAEIAYFTVWMDPDLVGRLPGLTAVDGPRWLML